MSTSLTVTQHTNLQDLKAFLDQVGDNAKIRGKYDENNNLVLYSSSKGRGLIGNLTGNRNEKRDLGLEAIKTILEQSSRVNHPNSEGLIQDILTQAKPGKELRKEGLQQILTRSTEEFQQSFMLNGREYTHVGDLGRDGNGLVQKFKTTVNGEDQFVAVKRPNPDRYQLFGDGHGGITPESRAQRDEAYGAIQREIDMHQQIVGGGHHDNILGMIGHTQSPHGEPMLVLPFVPNKDMRHLYENLKQEHLDPGMYNQVALTMLNDVGQSLQHMHEDLGMTHLDVKFENYMMDHEGRMLLMDFGTVQNGTNGQIDKYPVDGNSSVPPEVIRMRKLKSEGDPQLKQLRNETNNQVRDLERNGQKVPRPLREQLQQRDHDLEVSKSQVHIPAGEKNDSWVMGLMAYRLLVVPDKYDHESPLLRFGQSEFHSVRQGKEYEDSGLSFLDQMKVWFPLDGNELLHARIDGLNNDERNLINGLLHADPNQRMTVGQALQSPLFLDELGSPEVRQKMLEVAQKPGQ